MEKVQRRAHSHMQTFPCRHTALQLEIPCLKTHTVIDVHSVHSAKNAKTGGIMLVMTDLLGLAFSY